MAHPVSTRADQHRADVARPCSRPLSVDGVPNPAQGPTFTEAPVWLWARIARDALTRELSVWPDADTVVLAARVPAHRMVVSVHWDGIR